MRGTAILLVLALVGCGGGAYDWRTVQGGGRGLPEVAMRPSGETVVPPGRGAQQALAVRSFVPGAEGWAEVAGALCRITAAPFLVADVVTPVRLTLPDLGPDAPTLVAECESGTSRGSAAVAPVFRWPAEGRPQPAERAWWGGGWWWGYQKTGPIYYPDLAVGLRPAAATR